MAQIAYQTIELPQTVDCLQGILSVVPLQLMSFHLAVLRGYDVSYKFHLVTRLTAHFCCVCDIIIFHFGAIILELPVCFN